MRKAKTDIVIMIQTDIDIPSNLASRADDINVNRSTKADMVCEAIHVVSRNMKFPYDIFDHRSINDYLADEDTMIILQCIVSLFFAIFAVLELLYTFSPKKKIYIWIVRLEREDTIGGSRTGVPFNSYHT